MIDMSTKADRLMSESRRWSKECNLESQGVFVQAALYDVPEVALLQTSLDRKEGVLSQPGALMVNTGKFTLLMHCSDKNPIGNRGDMAVFYGLSGIRKTTLSTDPNRELIGDDEHGWYDEGIFNFEGRCYAKTIRLSKDVEPDFWNAVHSLGTVLKNVAINTRWTDGDYPIGNRMPINVIRQLLNAAMAGNLDDVNFTAERGWDLQISLSGLVQQWINLQPIQTWRSEYSFLGSAGKLVEQISSKIAELGLTDVLRFSKSKARIMIHEPVT